MILLHSLSTPTKKVRLYSYADNLVRRYIVQRPITTIYSLTEPISDNDYPTYDIIDIKMGEEKTIGNTHYWITAEDGGIYVLHSQIVEGGE